MSNAMLSSVVLKTRQVDNLRRFYGTLGIEMAAGQHGKGPPHYAGRAGTVLLEIYPLGEGVETADATIRLGFSVARVADQVEALRALGAGVTAEPRETQWGLRAVARDPDGRAVELCED